MLLNPKLLLLNTTIIAYCVASLLINVFNLILKREKLVLKLYACNLILLIPSQVPRSLEDVNTQTFTCMT